MLLVSQLRRVLCATRAFSSASAVAKVERLSSRSLLRVSGTEVSSFLQGLVTNDLRHLEEGSPAIYCVFLNIKGRILYDSVIYRTPKEDGTYLVECASESISALQKHLKLYRVRRKINIDDVASELGVWAAYGDDSDIKSKNEDLIIVRDPRLKDLGYRVIAPISADVTSELAGVPGDEYQDLRYRLGVGEGVEDLPPGNCNPLEANCDYLHGVSFHKGCYIGQELTARTHHTGVVRKRLMPLHFKPCEGQELPGSDTVVKGPEDRSVGKLRGLNSAGHGLGLLRVTEVLKSPDNLLVGSLTVSTHRPTWWPVEASKDRPAT